MVTEFERRYSVNTHPGAIRFLAYLNRADMFSYSGAIPILKANGVGADVSAASAYRSKYGFGLNWEQEIAKNVGVFSRLGWNDGQEEAWMFTDVDYTASLGLSLKGEAWHRPRRHLWSGGRDERHLARGAGIFRGRRLGHSGGRRHNSNCQHSIVIAGRCQSSV